MLRSSSAQRARERARVRGGRAERRALFELAQANAAVAHAAARTTAFAATVICPRQA
jgi:hypothetical protein